MCRGGGRFGTGSPTVALHNVGIVRFTIKYAKSVTERHAQSMPAHSPIIILAALQKISPPHTVAISNRWRMKPAVATTTSQRPNSEILSHLQQHRSRACERAIISDQFHEQRQNNSHYKKLQYFRSR